MDQQINRERERCMCASNTCFKTVIRYEIVCAWYTNCILRTRIYTQTCLCTLHTHTQTHTHTHTPHKHTRVWEMDVCARVRVEHAVLPPQRNMLQLCTWRITISCARDIPHVSSDFMVLNKNVNINKRYTNTRKRKTYLCINKLKNEYKLKERWIIIYQQ